MCFCMLGDILDVGADVQGGDLGAVGNVVQKDMGGFGTVEQKDVVAAGTVRKWWFFPGKESTSAVSHQSLVISPGLKLIDPMLGVGDDRCAWDIPPSPWCAASRPHEHTPGAAVPSGTVFEPGTTKKKKEKKQKQCTQDPM